jgi:membrane protein DedA with SNARE-associated domain
MGSVLAIIYANSYLILLLAAAINSATIAIMGGVASHAGHISIIWGVVFLTIGGSVFNQVYFYLGRRSERYFHHDKVDHPKAHKITKFISHHEFIFIFIYRFLPGVRFISPFIIGASTKLSQIKFLIVDMVASFIWSAVFFSIGFACGAVAKKFFSKFAHYENVAFIIIIAAVVLWFVIKKIIQYKKTGSIWRKHD